MFPAPLTLPNEIPVIVLSQAVLFPHSLLPLHIFEERYQKMLQSALDSSRIFGVVQESDLPDSPVSDLAEVMGIGVIRACVKRTDGTSDLILQGLARVRVIGELQAEPFRILRTKPFLTELKNAAKAEALAQKLKEQARSLQKIGYRMPEQMDEYLKTIVDPEAIGDLVAATFVDNPLLRQKILETAPLEGRLEMISGVLLSLA